MTLNSICYVVLGISLSLLGQKKSFTLIKLLALPVETEKYVGSRKFFAR